MLQDLCDETPALKPIPAYLHIDGSKMVSPPYQNTHIMERNFYTFYKEIDAITRKARAAESKQDISAEVAFKSMEAVWRRVPSSEKQKLWNLMMKLMVEND